MTSYRDLEIYKESKRLAIEVHALSLTLPKYELYEEGSQVRRSSKAVTSMIVEGMAGKDIKLTMSSTWFMPNPNVTRQLCIWISFLKQDRWLTS